MSEIPGPRRSPCDACAAIEARRNAPIEVVERSKARRACVYAWLAGATFGAVVVLAIVWIGGLA